MLPDPATFCRTNLHAQVPGAAESQKDEGFGLLSPDENAVQRRHYYALVLVARGLRTPP